MMFDEKGECAVIFVGPRAAGKDQIKNAVQKAFPRFYRPVSHTTRWRRPKEKKGRDYHFVSYTKYARLVNARKLVWDEYVGLHRYGCSIEEFDKRPWRLFDLTPRAALIAKARIETHGGRVLIVRIYAPPDQRRKRIRHRQPNLSEEAIDRMMEDDPSCGECPELSPLVPVIFNCGPDPVPAQKEAVRLVGKFLEK